MSKITLSVEQMIGKNLYAAKAVTAFTYPSKKAPVWVGFEPNTLIGKVDSWVVRTDGVWWQFATGYQGQNTAEQVRYYYVKHDQSSFQSPISQFTPAEQHAIAEQSKIDLPNWLTFGAAGFAWYQSTQPESAKYKLPLRIGAALLGAYGVTKVIEKIDFNPFDDLLDSMTNG